MNNHDALSGGLSVAIPGELLGYWEAHQRFGKLDWKELFQPAIDLCKKGSIINKYLENYMKSKESIIKEEPTLAEILINPATNNLYKVLIRICKTQKSTDETSEIAQKTP